MGGKGGNEAAAMRADEQARQQRIRQGTSRINSIFDTGWDPGVTSGEVVPNNGMLSNLVNQSPELQKQLGLTPTSAGGGYTGDFRGFNDDFFADRRQAFLDYATPQLEDQYGDAQKQLTYALSRGGLLNSSVRGQKVGELQKEYDLTKQHVADQAMASETDARNAVEDTRANLIAMLNSTGDAQGAANMAINRASALSKPVPFSPLSNLFASFTQGLGQQAALERANYYSGGQVGNRYNTGLFTPSSSSMVVR